MWAQPLPLASKELNRHPRCVTSLCRRRRPSSRQLRHGPAARQFNVTAVSATAFCFISRPSAATCRQRCPQAAMELLKPRINTFPLPQSKEELMLSASKEMSLKLPSISRALSQWPQRAL